MTQLVSDVPPAEPSTPQHSVEVYRAVHLPRLNVPDVYHLPSSCFVCLLFLFWPHCAACATLVPRRGIEPRPRR